MENEKENNVKHFLDLIQKSRRGKFKIYIGMSAGVGKTFRMLQEAHTLLKNGIDVKIGYIETHNRKETQELIDGLPIIPRRTLFYKGKQLEEMNLQAIINLRPEVAIVDELAHTNIEGSKNEKRWQDVLEILEAGINVISAVNIQHIESLNKNVKLITNIEVQERIPDSVLKLADEVVNIDLTADELIARLKEGKIYTADKIPTALNNFFKSDQILQLRELALKEVASQVVRKVENEVPKNLALKHDKFLACISSNDTMAKIVIRKTARLASYYNSKWYVLYVEIPSENSDKIALDKQRHLINNFKLATQLGGEVIKVQNKKITDAILEVVKQKEVTTVCIGKPHLSLFKVILSTTIFNKLLHNLSSSNIDLIILS
ncbi:histidine kinase [Flavobacterium psychrophilum]|uniref:Probable two-component system sensory protein n=1 Tax=Flavobacterium psychrophilum (strain ATCC 49511 / DSM 21280 / CIP 103535 / JIP02/86) TaxID=402612 RepID=A6H082_FLAPJ|nr:two-component system sensory protein [Flavobacterium psychrophilum]AIG30443.1 histidine kinase [Flavobacterium psychrophilum]AIG32718.1 histidine kinase [Flavobacterium psychrophilum]AIG34873.1 histidine kinase [Flavobacterium psychrophilum]AIG37238.1 histidine kinase [Flavobacterium psychrophilum]AIG39502.1 histidine kinase [Flavobacterium psychrophilum]